MADNLRFITVDDKSSWSNAQKIVNSSITLRHIISHLAHHPPTDHTQTHIYQQTTLIHRHTDHTLTDHGNITVW